VAVRAGEPAGTVEHPHDGDALARHVRRTATNQLDGVDESRSRCWPHSGAITAEMASIVDGRPCRSRGWRGGNSQMKEAGSGRSRNVATCASPLAKPGRGVARGQYSCPPRQLLRSELVPLRHPVACRLLPSAAPKSPILGMLGLIFDPVDHEVTMPAAELHRRRLRHAGRE
jgi:hypothetical protein